MALTAGLNFKTWTPGITDAIEMGRWDTPQTSQPPKTNLTNVNN